MKKKKRITVVGMGYVGLSIAILLSQNYDVTVTDIDEVKLNNIRRKICPIADSLMQEYLSKKRLNLFVATSDATAYANSDVVIICVPTNYDDVNKSFDISIVESTVSKAYSYNRNINIVIKSTLPVGATEYISLKTGCDNILYSPEFLREGEALRDNLYPSRIVVGFNATREEQFEHAKKFSEILSNSALKTDVPIVLLGWKEAEAVKLFSNAYLAMRIGFFNELDTFAEFHGLDAKKIIEGVGLDLRIGNHYNNPSFGFGGYCLPKDTKQLSENLGELKCPIIKSTIESNDERIRYIAQRISRILLSTKVSNSDNKTFKLGVYRLSMKKGSDNIRESSVLKVLEQIDVPNMEIYIYEPTIDKTAFEEYKFIDDLNSFKHTCALIIANRIDEHLFDVMEKVYSRDIFNCN